VSTDGLPQHQLFAAYFDRAFTSDLAGLPFIKLAGKNGYILVNTLRTQHNSKIL
jgi:hypothetical protein